MSTPIYPIMDNCYMDTYFFFVPCRLLWEHWENMFGENDTNYWAEKTEYSTPTCTIGGKSGLSNGISETTSDCQPKSRTKSK